MKIIKPSYEILSEIDRGEILSNIEKYGRTCYKSEENITEESASNFVKAIIKGGHHSVIEHENISVKFICDRGVTHEIVRHRLASYSQESTRYCNYSKDKFGNQLTVILPCWFQEIKEGQYRKHIMCPAKLTPEYIWFLTMLQIEIDYKELIERGWSPQQARSILPNSLKTEIVVTANLREWRHILFLRTSPKAHPQIREVMLPLLNELKIRLPEIFVDIVK